MNPAVRRLENAPMPEYEFIGKSKLGRGFSFPLKRSELDAFLDDNAISLVSAVGYCEPSDHHRVFAANYYGPRSQSDDPDLTLWINAVPSDIRHHIATEIGMSLLDQVRDWVIPLHDRAILANQMDHKLEIYYSRGLDDDSCTLSVKIDEPPESVRISRYRGKVRP